MASSFENTYWIYANSGGCPQNQLDASRLCAYLDGNGFSMVRSPKKACFIFVNGCSYRSEKETDSYAAVLKLAAAARPGTKIFVTGCLPKIAPDRAAELEKKFAVIPGIDLHRIEELIPPRFVTWNDCVVNRVPAQLFNYKKKFRRFLSGTLGFFRTKLPKSVRHGFDTLFMYDHSERSYLVRIGEGCLGKCTYCAIRFSRGSLKSKDSAAILREVRSGLARGFDEILLTATETAAWGRDHRTDLSLLLNDILEIPGDFDLLLFYANPCWLIDIWDNLEPIFATGRIHFLHLSLNGGSDGVLHRMARGYTLSEFDKLVGNIRRVSPKTVLQTQVIVGFPGETEEEFATTQTFFKKNYFHNVQVHAYDARPGTPAAIMHDQVPSALRWKRRRILYVQTLAAKLKFNASYLLSLPFRSRETSV